MVFSLLKMAFEVVIYHQILTLLNGTSLHSDHALFFFPIQNLPLNIRDQNRVLSKEAWQWAIRQKKKTHRVMIRRRSVRREEGKGWRGGHWEEALFFVLFYCFLMISLPLYLLYSELKHFLRQELFFIFLCSSRIVFLFFSAGSVYLV